MRTRSHALVAGFVLSSVLATFGNAAAQPPAGQVSFGGRLSPRAQQPPIPNTGSSRESQS